MIDWNKTSDEDLKLIYLAVDRAMELMEYKPDKMSLQMDLHAAHAASPLDLEKLLDFDEFNFLHDIYGIMRHIDRDTGEMTQCFLPRSHAREKGGHSKC